MRAAQDSMTRPTTRRYYEQYGRGCDSILRCKDCKTLVTAADMQRAHACAACGCRSLTEIRTLTAWEWIKIRIGWTPVAHRDEFLKEFSCGR